MQGIDVSNHQGLIDWHRVAAAGYGFAWCKVSEGSTYRDAFAPRNLAAAAAAGLLVGGYHFARPASSSPEVQAQLAASQVKAATLPLVLDLEQDAATAGWSMAQRLDWAGRFLARADALTGHRAALYTGAWYLAHQLGGGGALPTGRLLWLASYTRAAPEGPWRVWQYTSSGSVPGVAGRCDVSRTSLTRAQLATYAGTTPPPKPRPANVRRVVIVLAGMTLSGIAGQAGLSLHQVLAANPQIHNANVIHPGDRVTLPAAAPKAIAKPVRPPVKPKARPAARPPAKPVASRITVRRGDTLSGISSTHHLTLAKVLSLNPRLRAHPNRIYPGQIIRIR
jgi:GH25 family lysozyme M1 (1,4-beta-N-acetylmuramidase)